MVRGEIGVAVEYLGKGHEFQLFQRLVFSTCMKWSLERYGLANNKKVLGSDESKATTE